MKSDDDRSGVKPNITLSLGKEISIDGLIEFGLDTATIEAELKDMFLEAYRMFGVRPFSFFFDTNGEMKLRAESSIGFLSGRLFDIVLQSKIDNFDLGKALLMAQYCKSGALKVSSSKVRSQIDVDSEYTVFDLMGFSLVEVVNDIIKNGIAKSFKDVLHITNRKSGTIDFQNWINRGLLPPPSKTDIESDYNILPNRLIIAALKSVLDFTKNSKLSGLIRSNIMNFEGCDGQVDSYEIDNFKIHHFNIPRRDYESALSLSLAILRKKAVSFLEGEVNLPSALVDLNVVFEEFCSLQISELLNPEMYEVKLQPEYDHPISPEIGGYFSPDITIRNKKNKKMIVLDVKNKYKVNSDGDQVIANADLFQLSYYAASLGAKSAVLLYPSVNPKVEYPVKASESEAAYANKVLKYYATEQGAGFSIKNPTDESLKLYKYQIDLGGSLQNTIRSLAGICLFIESVRD
ncbi:hypothetical protein CIK05_11830 [Bdellovibrio sp. qaytius]|nr:hypothetical protein CIK05_11830 [Bdellovibrio sp. qaytius]